MISTRSRPVRRTSVHPRHEVGNGKVHDAGSLSIMLRELAVKAHRLVRQTDGPASSPGDAPSLTSSSARELSELHAQILELQNHIRAQALDGLAQYVLALRQEVEGHLT
jgi:hypothetical protein